MSKNCNKCGKSLFCSSHARQFCVDCRKLVDKERREKYKDNIIKNRKKPTTIYKRYKYRCDRMGKDFELTFEEFISFWNKPCYYCGSNIETIGLDRIDNSKGYAINNIVPCCIICNKMKAASSQHQFIEHCKLIAIRYNNKESN